METLQKEFAQIVKENKDTIYTVCYMFSNDSEDVNDLFQEVLIKVSNDPRRIGFADPNGNRIREGFKLIFTMA